MDVSWNSPWGFRELQISCLQISGKVNGGIELLESWIVNPIILIFHESDAQPLLAYVIFSLAMD